MKSTNAQIVRSAAPVFEILRMRIISTLHSQEIQEKSQLQKMSREWSNGIFDCFKDCSICLLAYFVPCYVFGKNAEVVGGSCVLCAVSQFVPVVNLGAHVHIRGKIREQRGIDGSCINDLMCVCCCGLCAIAQEAQEVKSPVGLGIARE